MECIQVYFYDMQFERKERKNIRFFVRVFRLGIFQQPIEEKETNIQIFTFGPIPLNGCAKHQLRHSSSILIYNRLSG